MSNCEQREGKWSHQSNISMCVEWVYAMNGTLQVDLIESTRAESLDEIFSGFAGRKWRCCCLVFKKTKQKSRE